MKNFQHTVVKKARVVLTCDPHTGVMRIDVVPQNADDYSSRVTIEVQDLIELELR